MAYMSWHLRRSLDTYVDGESTWQDTLDTHEDTLDTHEDNHHLRRCLKWTKYLPLFVVCSDPTETRRVNIVTLDAMWELYKKTLYATRHCIVEA